MVSQNVQFLLGHPVYSTMAVPNRVALV